MDQINQFATIIDAISGFVESFTYAIEDGCVENHLYESHARGKNWIATVTPNRAAPGGLDRAFWKKGSGKWYLSPGLKAGDLIEFGGDYYTGRGAKKADRAYTLVLRVEDTYFVGVRISGTAPSAKKLEVERALYGV